MRDCKVLIQKVIIGIISGISFIGMPLFLSSCQNTQEEVAFFAPEEDSPMEHQFGVLLTYSDSARKSMELRAAEAKNYPQLEEPKLEFPQGIDVTFFDDQEEEDSHLRADNAIRYPEKAIWEATGNVQVTNKKGERLDTEYLVWDERDEIIYSDQFVRITTGNQVIMGEGFEADQNFERYQIEKVTGELYVEDDQDSTSI
jgi:LPS export ABC transporter protein LptC